MAKMTKNDMRILQSAYHEYMQSTMYNMSDAYKKPSDAKFWAFERIKDCSARLGGSEPKIIHNSICTFTAGFIYNNNGVNTFVYFLPTRSLEYPVYPLRFMKI